MVCSRWNYGISEYYGVEKHDELDPDVPALAGPDPVSFSSYFPTRFTFWNPFCAFTGWLESIFQNALWVVSTTVGSKQITAVYRQKLQSKIHTLRFFGINCCTWKKHNIGEWHIVDQVPEDFVIKRTWFWNLLPELTTDFMCLISFKMIYPTLSNRSRQTRLVHSSLLQSLNCASGVQMKFFFQRAHLIKTLFSRKQKKRTCTPLIPVWK